jgi:hypothetical protein
VKAGGREKIQGKVKHFHCSRGYRFFFSSITVPFFAVCGSVGTVHYQHELAHSCLEAFGDFLWLNGFGTGTDLRQQKAVNSGP